MQVKRERQEAVDLAQLRVGLIVSRAFLEADKATPLGSTFQRHACLSRAQRSERSSDAILKHPTGVEIDVNI
jgi:hypothetical protein